MPDTRVPDTRDDNQKPHQREAVRVRKMREADLPEVLRILALWNMAPRPASAEVPDPERTTIDVANGFVAWLKARPQYNNDGAIDALFRYAAEAYPCKR